MKPKMMTHYLGVLLALARPLPLPVAVAVAVNAALPEAVGKKVQKRRQLGAEATATSTYVQVSLTRPKQ